MRFEPSLTECVFLRRYKRFLVDVRLPEGTEMTVHCPNTGAMTSCCEPGCRAWISDSGNPKRKLRHTLEVVEVRGARICVHSARANAVAAEGIAAGGVPELAGYAGLRREVRVGDSRLDLLLTDSERRDCYVEVKCATLGVGDGVSRFPDAVSSRARRHRETLHARVEAGDRAVLLFVCGRDDTRLLQPADEVDPAYGETLRAVASAGVEVLAHRCESSPEGLWLREAVPVDLRTGLDAGGGGISGSPG